MERKYHYTNQITVIHFSDLHFGHNHICNPEDATASKDGFPTLGELISKDLESNFGEQFKKNITSSEEQKATTLVAVTGDFTQKASHTEFEQAIEFLDKISNTKILNQKIDKSDIFIIPGNHDVLFDKKTPDERFQPYCNFYNKFFNGIRAPLLPHDALSISQIHKINKDGNKAIIAEINCCMYVQNDTVDKSRGQVAMDTIAKLRKELTNLEKQDDFNDYIKVAIIHHHIVLLPSFIEPKRGVDSVVNSRHLLELLSNFEFHAVLHGHKHYPHIFSYDPLPLWAENENKIPQLVIAGGSCGSNALPTGSTNSCNTYGVVTIKWHPGAKQGRIKVITRGLKNKGEKGQLTPDLWKWDTVNVSDKNIVSFNSLPSNKRTELKNWDKDDRLSYYKKLRFQLPVVEVMPSLIHGQAYEARAWIVTHKNPLPEEKKLIRVEWSAGELFSKQITEINTNNNFCISYQYWGPMLIEAKMTFKDGYIAHGYIYARMPKEEE